MSDILADTVGIIVRFVPPKNAADLRIDQFATLIFYVATTAFLTKRREEEQNFFRLLVSGINGMTMPLAFVLFTLPIFPSSKLLLNNDVIMDNLTIAGFFGVGASLWALFGDR